MLSMTPCRYLGLNAFIRVVSRVLLGTQHHATEACWRALLNAPC
jgi:hypothetical protein